MGINVLVEGASGYGGGEVLDRLYDHDYVDNVVPGGRRELDEDELESIDAVISALPSSVSAQRVARSYRLGKWVADLSGDLRLQTTREYKRWYGEEHPTPE